MTFWDYATGTPFQNMEDIPQPGSLEAEAGLFCSTFDMTGTRLITGGADKTIKVWVKLCQMMTPAKFLLFYIRSMQNRHHDWLYERHCTFVCYAIYVDPRTFNFIESQSPPSESDV
jgi:pleiotropic regulator 1